MATPKANNYDEVLPATDAQVARLRQVMKGRNPQDDFVIDGMSVMALIKRIVELESVKEESH